MTQTALSPVPNNGLPRLAILVARRGAKGEMSAGYYTGKTGAEWLSALKGEGYVFGLEEAKRQAALFNERTCLHGLTFEAVEA